MNPTPFPSLWQDLSARHKALSQMYPQPDSIHGPMVFQQQHNAMAHAAAAAKAAAGGSASRSSFDLGCMAPGDVGRVTCDV